MQDAGDFAAAAVQAAVAAQAAAEAQWRFHQQRLAAQQRAKMQAQAALAMAHAQQQAAATPSSESGKRVREDGGGLSNLVGDCVSLRVRALIVPCIYPLAKLEANSARRIEPWLRL